MSPARRGVLVALWLWLGACGVASTADGGVAGLEACATTGGATPGGDVHFELRVAGVPPGSALAPVDGGLVLREGGPALTFVDSFTRATSESGWPWRSGPRTLVGPTNPLDDLAVLLDPTRVGDFETLYGFNVTSARQALLDYRAATSIDPARQLAVRVGVSGTAFLVNGLTPGAALRPWVAGDTLVGGATRFLIVDLTEIYDFEGDAACHVRNLTRLLKPEGPLAVSHFFGTQSREQLQQVQQYLAVARPHTRLVTLRSNGPALPSPARCALSALETCLRAPEALAAAADAWLAACPAPTDLTLAGAPEPCLVEGKLTPRPWP